MAGRAAEVRPQVLRAGALHPEARLDDGAVVVLDSVIDARIQRELGDIGHGEVVVKRASGSGIGGRAAATSGSTRDVGCKVRSFSREIEEEMDIAARVGVEEGVYAVVGGVAAAGFLDAGGGFKVNLLVGVIVVEVIDPGDEVPESRRVGEVNLAAELSVGALRPGCSSPGSRPGTCRRRRPARGCGRWCHSRHRS